MSEVTYMVDCGPYDSNRVIHVDKMRIKHSQVLVGESENVAEDHKKGEALKESDLLTGRVYRKKITPSLPGKPIHPPDARQWMEGQKCPQ